MYIPPGGIYILHYNLVGKQSTWKLTIRNYDTWNLILTTCKKNNKNQYQPIVEVPITDHLGDFVPSLEKYKTVQIFPN